MQATGREPIEESVWSVLEARLIRCTPVCLHVGEDRVIYAIPTDLAMPI